MQRPESDPGTKSAAGAAASAASSGAPGADAAPPDPTRAIARTVLYEGYMLWPYRRTALKNQRRWTFGGVFPPGWTRADHADDPCTLRAEVLIEAGPRPRPGGVRVTLRFLQVVQRQVAALDDGRLRPVDELEVRGERHVTWQEAREREVTLGPLSLSDPAPLTRRIDIPAGEEREWLDDAQGARSGALVRSWRGIRARLEARVEAVGRGARWVRVVVRNETAWKGTDRQAALESSLVSTHLVLEAEGARFVSLTDPPAELADAAAACVNEGCWPVLVGPRESRSTMLASPIILSDHPQVAPESPGDLFDGGEIDELLVLNILGLTEEEQEEMRTADPRTREIFERTRGLTAEQMLRLHGTFRDVTPPDEGEGKEQR